MNLVLDEMGFGAAQLVFATFRCEIWVCELEAEVEMAAPCKCSRAERMVDRVWSARLGPLSVEI